MFEGVADVAWQDHAACARLEDPSVMFPAGAVDPAALHACATCPVKRQCREWIDQLEHGLETRDLMAGFVAGETVAQRIARRKRARARELAHA